MDSFPYKHILVVGATAGIGRAMAERFVRGGANVTVVGRRKERLDAFVQEHGADKARSVVFDVSDIAAIPAFAEEMMKNAVPQIDCVFLNAGFQRSYDLADQGSFDLDSFRKEMDVNFTSFVASVKAFLPFLQKRDASSFIFTTSNLSIIPAAPFPAYSASKAALNAFVLCLREQLLQTSVKVIEISPPAVQTELHDYMGERGREIGMPLDEFTTEAYNGLMSGKDQIVVGSPFMAPDRFREIVGERREAVENMAAVLKRITMM